MIQAMERAIAKREQIAIRHKGKSDAAAGRGNKARGGAGLSGSSRGGIGAGMGELTTSELKKKVLSTLGPFYFLSESCLLRFRLAAHISTFLDFFLPPGEYR